MTRQIVLDTETTGLDPRSGHKIIEIGCIEVVNRHLTGSTYQVYINPGRAIDPGAVAVHGITSEFLKDKPIFADVVDELIAYIKGAELIIHNAPFDLGFLDYEISLLPEQYSPIIDYCKVIDTLTMARKMHPGQKNSLDALCKRYEIDNSHREYHGALLDSEILAQVYLRMTGGQEQLFGDGQHHDAKTSQNASSNVPTQSRQQIDCPVTLANELECEQHRLRVADIQKASGVCLWEEQ